eukprot:CAMPEP_0169479088 /NCGR_PEP_ID=MMETSP1042-20121227/28831_1 /TAXON_ID=464988 /ORGANISM="Hemiselmis andersenii, Strain CCMP1180" /LENGTH=53 /DNA_ID=CAMNT_0009593617 /DNA_START=76 /DNA_END=233 /DNA_ORIENTATION=-
MIGGALGVAFPDRGVGLTPSGRPSWGGSGRMRFADGGPNTGPSKGARTSLGAP